MADALIDTLSDPRLDPYRNLPDPELLQRHGLFVAEGRIVVRRLLAEGRLGAESVLVTEPARRALADILDVRPDLPVYVVGQDVMDGVTGFNIHRGCLAIGRRPPVRSWRDIVSGVGITVVIERVANADNIGGIFRNAAAFEAGAVLLDPTATDPLYRKAIRTSLGATLLVPFARAEPWPDALHELRSLNVATLALTPAATARPLRAVMGDIGDRPVALVLGHEGDGLTPAALEACEYRARVPIASRVDSLNVSAAAAVVLYELTQAQGRHNLRAG